MANILYPNGKEHLANAEIDFVDDNIKVVLVDTADYTYNAADDALDDIPAVARVAISGNLAGKTNVDGVCDANDVVFSTVSGDESEALVIYKDSGVEATSYLIARFDTSTGLPVIPNGTDITITWNASGIFAV